MKIFLAIFEFFKIFAKYAQQPKINSFLNFFYFMAINQPLNNVVLLWFGNQSIQKFEIVLFGVL